MTPPPSVERLRTLLCETYAAVLDELDPLRRVGTKQVPSRTPAYLYEPRTIIQPKTTIADAISSTVTVIYNRRPRIVRSTDLIAAQAIAHHVTAARHRFVAPI